MSSARHNVALTLALSDSDHVRDLVTGTVPVEGVDLTCLTYEVEEIFFRFARYREWDIGEFSMGKFSALRAADDTSVVGIPVFTSRAFRHSALYVRDDGPRDDPGALSGGRIGIPEWTVTATVYGRDLLSKEYGVGLTDVEWVQGGTNEPGRVETLPVEVPDDVRVTVETQKALNDLLLAGEVDAILAPHPPTGFEDGTGRLVHLFRDPEAVERAYLERTGIFPIMHLIVIRREVYEENRWIAANLLTAFSAAKERALARALDSNAARAPIPWANAHAREITEALGSDPWPYGIDANRRTLSAFLEMGFEQGLCSRRLEPDELFVPEVQTTFRI
ncbi:MAG: 4,5-dihydroxyphthalate decarboxylase [Actinomycetota bacterium]|nr:4,5-dihydroxyphthalate decarboxylase [Actinomycetota bacterium]